MQLHYKRNATMYSKVLYKYQTNTNPYTHINLRSMLTHNDMLRDTCCLWLCCICVIFSSTDHTTLLSGSCASHGDDFQPKMIITHLSLSNKSQGRRPQSKNT